MTLNANPYRVYRETQIQTASGLELVVLLYNGAIKFLKQAAQAIQEKQVVPAHNALIRAQDIISELRVTLNHDAGGEIARALDQLYEYMNRRLMEANLHKELAPVQEVTQMLEELRDTWQEIGRRQQTNPVSNHLNIAK
jgi:flagellar protein FliS